MECLVTRFMVMILREFGVNPPRIKVISVKVMEMDVFKNQFQKFITKQISMDYDDSLANRFFTDYTLCDAQRFQNILISQMNSFEKAIVERGLYKIEHNSKVNERTMQIREGMVNMVKDKCDDGLVITESRKVDQDAEQCLDKRPLLASIIEIQKTESLNQPLEFENDCLKKTIAQFQKDFSKLEAQSIAFEIALQHKNQENNSLKTIQKENANFLASLQIENAHLKQNYKDLFESFRRSKVESNQ
ncbi:hypothetical protein Tco_1283081 [Tanacetum coccineum]